MGCTARTELEIEAWKKASAPKAGQKLHKKVGQEDIGEVDWGNRPNNHHVVFYFILVCHFVCVCAFSGDKSRERGFVNQSSSTHKLAV